MSSPLVGVTAVNSLLFGVYGSLLEWTLPDPSLPPSLTQIFLAGCGSGLVNAIISCPMELTKIRLQIQTDATHTLIQTKMPHFASPWHCFKHFFRTKGLRGVYLGFPVTVLRETPSYGTYFVVYEGLCRYLAARNGNPNPEKDAAVSLSPGQVMMAGGIAGIAGWMSTYPVDVIKTKIQSADHGTYRGFWDCMRHTIRHEGGMGLWRGTMATIVRAFPTNAATFFAYHHTMELLKQV
jgi:solute carrier family 25 carnitine/acylcarnitine transporter 20/29